MVRPARYHVHDDQKVGSVPTRERGVGRPPAERKPTTAFGASLVLHLCGASLPFAQRSSAGRHVRFCEIGTHSVPVGDRHPVRFLAEHIRCGNRRTSQAAPHPCFTADQRNPPQNERTGSAFTLGPVRWTQPRARADKYLRVRWVLEKPRLGCIPPMPSVLRRVYCEW